MKSNSLRPGTKTTGVKKVNNASAEKVYRSTNHGTVVEVLTFIKVLS
jgi:hypothetical protein